MQTSPMTTSIDAVAAEQQRFMVRVYNWMTTGLGITGLVAYTVADTPALTDIIFGNAIIPIALVIAQLGLVFWLATRVMQMSAQKATGVFQFFGST